LRRFIFSSPMAVAMNRHNVLMKAPSVPRESHEFLLSHHVTSTPILLLQPPPRIPAMNETISTMIACPESLTPVGGIIAVASSEIFHQQALYSRSKLINANFTGIDHYVVIVVVGTNIWKLLDV
jgi:hypothetical protein